MQDTEQQQYRQDALRVRGITLSFKFRQLYILGGPSILIIDY